MSLQVTRVWTCEACGRTVTMTDSPNYPAGWHHQPGRDYCERHTIVVTYRHGVGRACVEPEDASTQEEGPR